METQIQQKIVNNLQSLNTIQLSEVLDFVEFLSYKHDTSLPDPEVIDTLCGKYKNYLSSSDEFAKKKEEEIKSENNKWQTR